MFLHEHKGLSSEFLLFLNVFLSLSELKCKIDIGQTMEILMLVMLGIYEYHTISIWRKNMQFSVIK